MTKDARARSPNNRRSRESEWNVPQRKRADGVAEETRSLVPGRLLRFVRAVQGGI